MTNSRQLAVAGYYYATLPWRLHKKYQLCQRGMAPLCVLFYHRVADSHPNDWSISKAEFALQMDWLQKNVDLVSLPEVQGRMRAGSNEQIAVSITFDDGYAENCEFAIPYLVARQIPCTYFVALDFSQHNRPFPHDVENGQPLSPNTIDQLKAMADQGIEIGAHTRTHCDMGQVHDEATLRDEIVAATEELGDLLGHPIRYFAFPYGQIKNLNASAADLVRHMGLAGVCSAYGAYNLPGDDPFHIQRIHGDPEFERFRNWLTLDPRKLSIGRSFEMPHVEMVSTSLPC